MARRIEVGLLHPGAMGHLVGGLAQQAGARVSWVSEGRSADSRRRAANQGFRDAGSLEALAREADMILSVCPPHAAVDVARAVAAEGFSGVYLDANAVAPATARRVASIIEEAGGRAVDGGIVGPPPERAGTTRLYVSGTETDRAAELFAGTPLDVIAIGPKIGAASALKMSYAAYTKGSFALLIAIRALAAAEGVDEALLAEWAISQPGLADRSLGAVRRSAGKAWRYAGEMREIAQSFEAHGLPGGFHRAAAELYEALAPFKDAEAAPGLAEAVRQLLDTRPG
jgi:3-hydroxyisobutyrate dehydrogenase-like beta-hydroxyacid dehydrogenase